MKAKIGDQYQYLTIVDDGAYKDIGGKRYRGYHCRCKCGKYVYVPYSKWWITESCDCKRRETLRNAAQQKKEKEQRAEEAKQATARLIDSYLTGYKPNAQAR